MKHKIMCCALLMSVSGISMAAVTESCPEPSSIRHAAGIYTASTQAAGGEWLGVVSSSRPAAIKSFDSATFYAGEGTDETVGILGKCAYISESGDRVDLRYQRDQSSEIPVKLQNVAAWKRSDGPFGLVIYECEDKKKDACAFVEHK